MRLLLAALLVVLIGCKETMRSDAPTPSKDPSLAWDALLGEVVTADGYVDYDRLQAKREVLDTYVAWLHAGRIPRPSLEKYAWWINTYNALVLWTVLEEGRPASVRDVEPTSPLWPGPPGVGFFQQRQFPIAPDRLSLNEILHEKLRMVRQDVRLHAATNDATMSAPPLRDGLYEGKRIRLQLRDQMVRWIHDPARGVRIVDGQAEFPPAFERYRRDFDHWTAGDDLCTTAAHFARGELREQLDDLADAGCPHRFRARDWSLNHAPLGE